MFRLIDNTVTKWLIRCGTRSHSLSTVLPENCSRHRDVMACDNVVTYTHVIREWVDGFSWNLAWTLAIGDFSELVGPCSEFLDHTVSDAQIAEVGGSPFTHDPLVAIFPWRHRSVIIRRIRTCYMSVGTWTIWCRAHQKTGDVISRYHLPVIVVHSHCGLNTKHVSNWYVAMVMSEKKA